MVEIGTKFRHRTREWLRLVLRGVLGASAVCGGMAVARAAELHARPVEVIAEGIEPPEMTREADGYEFSLEPLYATPNAPITLAPLSHEAPSPSRDAPTGPFTPSLRDGLIMTGATPHRLILFTFDDGPDHRYTPPLLDTLDRLGIKAVFFLTARRFAGGTPWERRVGEIAREIVRRGHFVGSHTMDHLQLPLLGREDLEAQVGETEKVFQRVLGQRPWLIRPPGGARSERIDRYLAQRGYTQMLWNVGTGDFQVRSSDEVLRTFRRVLERRERENGERGGIILLHDIHEWSVEAFPRIVRWLEQRNCELYRDGEELYDIVDDPRIFFVPRGEAPAYEEAPPVMPTPEWLERRQAALRQRADFECSANAQ